MRKVNRDEIVDYQTYSDGRDSFRAEVMRIKEPRRIGVGSYLTFLFENPTTIRYQIQEIMRAERIAREADILHELEVYNDMLGDEGELGAVLLIEIPDEQERKVRLREWVGLIDHLYVELEDGTKIRPTYDSSQVGDDKLSSVQYLKFPVGNASPVAVGTDFGPLSARTELGDAQRQALQDDLSLS